MALWSNKTVQVPGLASIYASSGPIAAQSRRHYILDTTSNTIVVNLPTGIDGTTIRISDAKGTFLTNNVTVNPASGEKINNLATNESLILDANEMWIEFTWNASAGSWIVNAPGILALITNSYTDYPYITSPSSPASSTLRLYAKSDGKLYTKDSAGSEKKVGGGLDHPTTGSTFEVDSYNLSMTGQYNTGIGIAAGAAITSGVNNTFIGYNASYQHTIGSNNVAIGANASASSIFLQDNTAIGSNALQLNSAGSRNVAVGSAAGQYNSGNNNTFINATGTAFGATLTGVVAIGMDSTVVSATATADNQFVLGTSNHLYRFPGVVQTSLVLGPTGTVTGNTGIIRFRELAANGTHSVGLRAADSVAADVTWTLPAADGTNGQALITNGSGTLSWAAAGNTIVLVTQNSHGFVAADIGRPLYLNGSTYTYARADLEATAEVAGLIYSIIDTNTFQICLGGEVTSVGANLIEGGGSLVAGEVYFLSPTTAGRITTTPPSVVGQISKPIGVARTTTALDFYNMRGSAVGGSNVYTQISLANASATTIQNASAYNAVELVGFIYINATTPYRFTFKAQVTKKGDATDYLISYQTSGDTPPVGFNISVTTGGLVQATLPSVVGFTSAIAQFSLNGPAVGASLPLSIDSSNVSFGTVQAKDSSGIVFKNSSGTTIASFNNAGVLTRPFTPEFFATAPSSVAATNIVLFSSIESNTGSYYNSTTGRFTAQIAGVYYVTCTGGNSIDYFFDIRKNGTAIGRAEARGLGGTNFFWQTVSRNVYLNIGDYLDVQVSLGTVSFNSPYGGFGAFFIG